MSIELRIISSPFFKFQLSSCVPCESIQEDPPFSYPACRIQLYCGWALVLPQWRKYGRDAWLYFPGLKVGKIYLFFLFDYLVALIINRNVVRSSIIPELCGWLGLSKNFLAITSKVVILIQGLWNEANENNTLMVLFSKSWRWWQTCLSQ